MEWNQRLFLFRFPFGTGHAKGFASSFGSSRKQKNRNVRGVSTTDGDNDTDNGFHFSLLLLRTRASFSFSLSLSFPIFFRLFFLRRIVDRAVFRWPNTLLVGTRKIKKKENGGLFVCVCVCVCSIIYFSRRKTYQWPSGRGKILTSQNEEWAVDLTQIFSIFLFCFWVFFFLGKIWS